MTTQAFILHSHKKTILVVKIIVSLQNSPHHHLQTTFKDAEFIMLIYFLFIASHFSTLYYNIQRYFLFSLRTFPLRRNLSEKASPHLSQQEFSHQEQAFMALWETSFNVLGLINKEPPDLSRETTFTSNPKMLNPVSVPRICLCENLPSVLPALSF